VAGATEDGTEMEVDAPVIENGACTFFVDTRGDKTLGDTYPVS